MASILNPDRQTRMPARVVRTRSPAAAATRSYFGRNGTWLSGSQYACGNRIADDQLPVLAFYAAERGKPGKENDKGAGRMGYWRGWCPR